MFPGFAQFTTAHCMIIVQDQHVPVWIYSTNRRKTWDIHLPFYKEFQVLRMFL